MNVVIVGGGIVGLSCAHALAARGESVTVCEAGTLGGGNTGRAAGGIRTQFSTRVNVELSLASISVWDDFEAEFGVDIGYRRTGYLFLAREEETAAAFRENVSVQNDAGASSRLLDPDDARAFCPELRATEFVAAAYSPLDGAANPNAAVEGYSRAVDEAGVDVRTETPVTDIERVGDGTGGGAGDGRWRVETPEETLSADYVVNAAGAWARRVGRLAGVELPVSPRRRQMAVVDPDRTLPETVPSTVDLDAGSHFRPEREGTAVVGGHFAAEDPDVDPETLDESADIGWIAEAIGRANDCAGYFGPETRIRNGRAGLYAVTPDRHAVVDEVRPGFVAAAGFSGHGFQHAPATGECVAELVCDGRASHVDVSELVADRFDAAGGEGPARRERNVA